MKRCYNRNTNGKRLPTQNGMPTTVGRKDAMKKLCCKMGEFFRSIGRYQFGKQYDLTLSLYADGETETPECSHRFEGNSRHNLLKYLGMVGAVAVMISVISLLCSLCRMGRK